MNVLLMPLLMGPSALCQVITLLRVGLAITLIPLPGMILATTLVKSWKHCTTIELNQRRYLTTGVSAVFSSSPL